MLHQRANDFDNFHFEGQSAWPGRLPNAHPGPACVTPASGPRGDSDAGRRGQGPNGAEPAPEAGPSHAASRHSPPACPPSCPRKCEGRCPGRVCPGRCPREHRKPRTRGASLLLRMNRLWKGAAGCAGEGEGRARKLPGPPGPAVITQRGLCLAPKAGWAWAGEGAARPTWPRTEPPASLPLLGGFGQAPSLSPASVSPKRSRPPRMGCLRSPRRGTAWLLRRSQDPKRSHPWALREG